MVNNSRAPQDRKLALVGPLVALVIVLALAAATLWLSHRSPPPPPPAPMPAPPVVRVAPSLPPALTRTELIQAQAAQASIFAAGEANPTETSPLVGRKFSIRIPFGCGGTQVNPISAPGTVEFDAKTQSVRLRALPTNLTALPLVQALPDSKKIETVEGFWLPRPWTRQEACPPADNVPPPATPTPPAAQTLALAQFFPTDSSRAQQRGGRAYEAVRKVSADASILSHAYFFLLEGRIVGYPDHRAMHCWAESPDHRPICVYRVEFDHVAFEDASDGAVVAEWKD